MKIPRRVWSFYRMHPRIGAITIGWRWDVARYGIAIGLGLRENLVEGEIRWRWWWTWSPPEIRLLWYLDSPWMEEEVGTAFCPMIWEGEDVVYLASAWTGRHALSIAGIQAFGRQWWWR